MKPAIGTKVKPHSKTVLHMKGLDMCEYLKDAVNQGRNFLYIVDYDGNDFVLNNVPPKNYDFTKSYEWNTEKKLVHKVTGEVVGLNDDYESDELTMITGYRATGNLYKGTDFTIHT